MGPGFLYRFTCHAFELPSLKEFGSFRGLGEGFSTCSCAGLV